MGQLLDLGTTPGKAAPGESVVRTVVDLGAAYSNNAAETSVLSAGAIAGAFPAGITVGDAVHIRAAGTWLNNSGGNQTLTLNVYMGATLIAGATSTSLGAGSTARNWQVDLEVVYSIIGGAGVGAIRPVGQIILGITAVAGFATLGAASNMLLNAGAAATIATNAAATADLKAQTSNGTATTTVTCNLFRARYFPKV